MFLVIGKFKTRRTNTAVKSYLLNCSVNRIFLSDSSTELMILWMNQSYLEQWDEHSNVGPVASCPEGKFIWLAYLLRLFFQEERCVFCIYPHLHAFVYNIHTSLYNYTSVILHVSKPKTDTKPDKSLLLLHEKESPQGSPFLQAPCLIKVLHQVLFSFRLFSL